NATPLVAAALAKHAEIVIFGGPCDVNMQQGQYLIGESGIVIRADETRDDKLRISRFVPGEEDRRVFTAKTIGGVIQGIVTVGGNYGDCISVLRRLKENGMMHDRLALDKLPKPMRQYHREETQSVSLSTNPDGDDLIPDNVGVAKRNSNATFGKWFSDLITPDK
ncbi:MAG: hypothetical protein AAFP69_12750, partial [Planctomycetota bacterium]